jgi:hypothetical protein
VYNKAIKRQEDEPMKVTFNSNSNQVYVCHDQYSKTYRVYAHEQQAINYCKEMNKYRKQSGKEFNYYSMVKN